MAEGSEDLERNKEGKKWKNDKQSRRENHVIIEERTLLTLVKSGNVDIRVEVKRHMTKKNQIPQNFIDIREWWYAQGPDEPPVPKRAGVMLHREHMGRIIEAILKELAVGEISEEHLESISVEIERIGATEP